MILKTTLQVFYITAIIGIISASEKPIADVKKRSEESTNPQINNKFACKLYYDEGRNANVKNAYFYDFENNEFNQNRLSAKQNKFQSKLKSKNGSSNKKLSSFSKYRRYECLFKKCSSNEFKDSMKRTSEFTRSAILKNICDQCSHLAPKNKNQFYPTGPKCIAENTRYCQNHWNGFSCICKSNYGGQFCEIKNYCQNKCNQEGTVDCGNWNNNKCQCAPNYSGEFCEKKDNCPVGFYDDPDGKNNNCRKSICDVCQGFGRQTLKCDYQTNFRCQCSGDYDGFDCSKVRKTTTEVIEIEKKQHLISFHGKTVTEKDQLVADITKLGFQIDFSKKGFPQISKIQDGQEKKKNDDKDAEKTKKRRKKKKNSKRRRKNKNKRNKRKNSPQTRRITKIQNQSPNKNYLLEYRNYLEDCKDKDPYDADKLIDSADYCQTWYDNYYNKKNYCSAVYRCITTESRYDNIRKKCKKTCSEIRRRFYIDSHGDNRQQICKKYFRVNFRTGTYRKPGSKQKYAGHLISHSEIGRCVKMNFVNDGRDPFDNYATNSRNPIRSTKVQRRKMKMRIRRRRKEKMNRRNRRGKLKKRQMNDRVIG